MSKNIVIAIFINSLLIAAVAAQTVPGPPPGFGSAPMIAGFQAKAGVAGVSVDGMDEAPVKGMPFCAVISTEHTQPFADGNRIHTTDASTFCRDSMGRTRREASLNLLGAAPQKSGVKLITIVDPVAGYRYVLDTNSKTARRMPLPSADSAPFAKGTAGAPPAGKLDQVMFFRTEEAPGPNVVYRNVFVNKAGPDAGEPPPASENLGDQTIDGIHATGTRITTTIPAGRLGNEQPIRVTSERWYSPELKATVLTKHNDPWAGEVKTEFTSVSTSEPDTSLFVVPSDYKIVDEKAGPFTIKLPPPAPPAE